MQLVERLSDAIDHAQPKMTGKVTRIVGLNLEVAGLEAAIGDAVIVNSQVGPLHAEVVAIRDDGLICMPYGEMRGVRSGAEVETTGKPFTISVGDELLGRVIDGLGRPLDGGPSLEHLMKVPIDGHSPHPLKRDLIDTQLPLGVRAIDTLLPCGRGQRMGIFAGSGVGKSTLLSMIARGTEADISVIGLIGERGREVREFIENDLGPDGLARSVVVVATSDEPALVRLRAAFVATRVAEHFRDQGRDVVLMMDSITRFCMAQREVGLSAGEPPATRGYPPSVFAMLPKLLERAGASDVGSITGLYTVLVEGDDMNEPVGDTARSILDGHIVLSRRLASAGHYPCIDILDSISRLVPMITSKEQRAEITEIRKLMAAYREAKDLIEIGAYVTGTNQVVDNAVVLNDAMNEFLCQPQDLVTTNAESWAQLDSLVGAIA